MKAILMAAGRGTRIARHINGAPKCTLDIGGISLIENSVKTLIKKGINNIAIVIGYEYKYIKEILKDYDITYYYNPFYQITNSIASLWVAKDFINEDEDVLLFNGDVYFEEDILTQVIEEKLSPVLFADRSRAKCGDYKFYYTDNILKKFGKELGDEESTGEYIGIAKIGKEFIGNFKKSLDALIWNQNFNMWWEDALYSLSDKETIYVKDIYNKFWAEIDYLDDYLRILRHRNENDISVYIHNTMKL